jgi:hypothetical protein
MQLPAPRFWKRARIRDEIANLKAGIRQTQSENAHTWEERQRRFHVLRDRQLRLAQQNPMPRETFRQALREMEQDAFSYPAYRWQCSSPDELIRLLETQLTTAEQRLRQLDAQ